MKVTIKGVDHGELDPGKLSFDEGVEIEDKLGVTFTEFGRMLADGSMRALRAYVLILCRRTDPSMRMEDVGKMGMHELEFVTEAKDKAAAKRAKANGVAEADPTRTA